MLRHPALLPAEVGSDAQRKALFAQQHVSAVAGVDRDDGVVLGEVANVAVFLINLALAVQAAHPVVAVTQSFEHILAHAGHDRHVQHDVDGVGQLNAVFGKGRADRTHGIGDDVHRAALVAAAGDVVQHLVRFRRGLPVVGGTGVLFLFGADEGAALHTGNVVDGGAVQIAAGQLLLVELNHLAGGAGLLAQLLKLLLAAGDPNDLVGLDESDFVFDPVENRLVGGQCLIHRSELLS